MTIRLFTGTPGAGKSLCLVDEACKLREKEPERPFFAVGVDGLRPDVATPLPSVDGWRDLPDGSIVLVDEAWRHFPPHGQSVQPPEWVTALAEHRHRGFDFLLATQHPTQISSFVRHLCGEHTHLVRKFGTHMVQRIVWQSVHTDVQSLAAVGQGQVSSWRFPKKRFELYTSATMHTVKRRIPKRVYVAVAGLFLFPLIAYFGWREVHALGHPTSVGPAAGSVPAVSVVRSDSSPETTAQWVAARLPRVKGVPWSAPMWDGLKPTTTPDLLCVETQETPDFKRCSCYTEQATPLPGVPDRMCRQAAEHGVYNPYRPQPDSGQGQGVAVSEAHASRDTPARDPSSGIASAGGQPGTVGAQADWSSWQPGASLGQGGSARPGDSASGSQDSAGDVYAAMRAMQGTN